MAKDRLIGYRGLDLTDEKGQLCGKILADLGADVIKVERPGGDPARAIGPYYNDEADPEKSLFWFCYNANKRGITLDLNTRDGQELFKKLAASVDFVIESFDPGYLESVGLGYGQLSKINPKLVLTSITPFGQTGPYARYPASDLTVCALGGLMSDCGEEGRPPLQVSCPQSYVAASAEASAGTMLALFCAATKGFGQHVDVSAMESSTWAISEKLPYWTMYQYNRQRAGNRLRFMLLGAKEDIQLPLMWECADGYVCYAFLGGMPGARNNQKLVEMMDEKGMATDYLKAMDWARFDLLATDPKELDEQFTQPMKAFFKTRGKKELYEKAVAVGMSCYPVHDTKEVSEDPQLASRNWFQEVEHAELGATLRYPGALVALSETAITIDRRAPLIGEHNEEVYCGEMGLSKADLVLLKQAGAI